VLGTVDKGAQLLWLHSSLFEVSKRGQKDLGKPRLRSERGEVVMRLGLAQELFHNQGGSQRREWLLALVGQGVFSNFTGKIAEGEAAQAKVPVPGPGDRAPQAQGQEVARRQDRERSQGIGGLERLHGSDEGVLQNSERVADEQALLRHGLCLWVFAEFCKDLCPSLRSSNQRGISLGQLPGLETFYGVRRSNVAQLVLHLIGCHMIKYGQQPPGNLIGWAAHGDDNAVVRLPCCKVLLSKRLEVGAVVREQCLLLTDRIRQLLR